MTDKYSLLIKQLQEAMQRDVSLEEAIESLKACGILDDSGNVCDAYADIVIRSSEKDAKV